MFELQDLDVVVSVGGSSDSCGEWQSSGIYNSTAARARCKSSTRYETLEGGICISTGECALENGHRHYTYKNQR